MKERRNIVCKVRLNDDEQQLFNEKAESYGGNTSAMIRDAVAQFNDKKSRGKIQTLSELLNFYKEYQQRLSWYGGNFNQAMHHANELAMAGQLSQQYYHSILMPKMAEGISAIREMKMALDNIHNQIEKL